MAVQINVCVKIITIILVLSWTFIGVPACTIKCGIVEPKRDTGDESLLDFTRYIWASIRHKRNLEEIDFSFKRIERNTEMDWDTFVKGNLTYMDINTENVTAIVGPYIQPTVASSERYGIPYFVMNTIANQQYIPYNVIRVYLEPTEVYQIATYIVERYSFTDVALFYEESYGIQLIENLVTRPEMRVRAYKLHSSLSNTQLRDMLASVRQIPVTNLILAASKPVIITVLRQALHLSMLSSRFTWILSTLNIMKSDLTPFAYTGVNLTIFQLANESRGLNPRHMGTFTRYEYETLYDSLLTLYEAVRIHKHETGNCFWTGKELISSTLSKVDIEGATGRLAYRLDGTRHGYIVNILTLNKSEQLIEIGIWNSSIASQDKLRLHPKDPTEGNRKRIQVEYPFGGKAIVKVVTVLEEPFVTYVTDYQSKTGNERFEGYCVDLMAHIAEELSIEYELYLAPDGQFGSRDSNGSWNGMVHELMVGNAHLSVASLTITAQREMVIDFTKPFRPRGLSLMMKKTETKSSIFQLLDPLSPLVWALIIVVLVTISVILYILDKMAQPCNSKENQFSFSECVWFTFASLLRNSVDHVPKSVPGKIMAGFLWFFSLIIISTYTANLAAFLTISKFATPIQSVFDLANQAKVKYGTVRNSASSDFFEYNKLDYFQQVWQYMAVLDNSGMTESHMDGFLKIQQSDGDYAFIWDADVIRHAVNKDCSLVEVGQVFDNSKGYGIGTPIGATYRDDVSMAILKLNEAGKLLELDRKWWEKPSCPDAIQKKATGARQALSLDCISGVFVVLCAGVIIAFITALVMFCIQKGYRKNTYTGIRILANSKSRRMPKRAVNGCEEVKSASLVEEPFLPNSVVNPPGCSKQTNIF